ncbi:hypothetical protein C8R46DRAFT_1215856 [Mycena filopes]|nr:hypothetical protein C8R46DRAFT_1215856 [Mycena filopes]
MLPVTDGGVVDPLLLVDGTANLRVVDAWVILIHVSALLQATEWFLGVTVEFHPAYDSVDL